MARSVAEKGLPDWVIQAQVGHVAPEMMKTYSHIRRQALNEAADALEPNAHVPAAQPTLRTHRARVMSQSRHNRAVRRHAYSDLCGKLAPRA